MDRRQTALIMSPFSLALPAYGLQAARLFHRLRGFEKIADSSWEITPSQSRRPLLIHGQTMSCITLAMKKELFRFTIDQSDPQFEDWLISLHLKDVARGEISIRSRSSELLPETRNRPIMPVKYFEFTSK